jgi:BirA family biotin operon repressor/biotin-[acetyl-CoA-carboxylase] ligase
VARSAGDRGLTGYLAVFADWQRAGRGQAGRSWFAPPALGLLCSTLWRPEIDAVDSAAIGQMAGVACCWALGRLSLGARLKWPNDVVLGGAKVGGILVEGAVQGPMLDYAVVGIGLNVKQRSADLPPTPYPATSLALATGCHWDRDVVAAALLLALGNAYERWLADPQAIHAVWRASLETLGRDVTVAGPDGYAVGRAVDVALDGALLVQAGDGSTRRVVSGEVSLRD